MVQLSLSIFKIHQVIGKTPTLVITNVSLGDGIKNHGDEWAEGCHISKEAKNNKEPADIRH